MVLAELDVLETLALSEKHVIVVVDDEPEVQRSLRRLLRREPYDLRITGSAELALGWVERDNVSLVVLDHRMPGMCGTELAERVRRISPHTVRIMLTAYPGNALVRYGLAEDVQWLVSKPWNDDALRLTIRRLLRDLESKPPSPQFRAARGDRADLPGKAAAATAQGASLAPGPLRKAIRYAAGRLAKGTGWVLGFLWMADAGGAPRS